MPRTPSNIPLRDALSARIESSGLSILEASRQLETQHTTLWRFLRTGRACQRTVKHIDAGLERLVARAEPRQAQRKRKASHRAMPEDIAFLRQVLHTLLEALDTLEATPTSQRWETK